MPVRIDDNDAWYASEESTRRGMVEEIQRIRRRTRVRPWPVIVLALLVTVGITYKFATRPALYEAEVVLALREGSLVDAGRRTGLPVGELKEFVGGVLLPDVKLAELIERRNLHRLRHRLGMQWAINELREQLSIDVWRNSFVYYDPELPGREASARIGLTVVDGDPDDAFLLAHDLADLVVQSVREYRLQIAKTVASRIASLRDALNARMTALELERSAKLLSLAQARKDGRLALAGVLHMHVLEVDERQKQTERTLSAIAQSQDVLADRIAAAGLDLIVEIVSERRPDRPESKGFLIAMITVVVGLGALFGSALVLGAFDSRVHEVDDVARLGLPVLGHVPGFPGDRVGSLEARGVQRAPLPSFLRWRSR